MEMLRRVNLVMALLLFVEAVVLLIMRHNNSGLQPISGHFLAIDKLASNSAGHNVWVPASKHLFDLNIAYVIVAFLLISALIRVLIGTVWRKKYEAELNNKVGRARWLEFATAGGLLLLTVAMLTGVLDLASLTMLFVINLAVCILGLVWEFARPAINPAGRWVPWLGVVLILTPWLVLGKYLFDAILYGDGLARYVYVLVASVFVLFLLFAANEFMMRRGRGRWGNYVFGELMFIILSFVTLTAVAWQVFAGILKA